MKLSHIRGRTWLLEGESNTVLYQLDARRCILLDSGERWEREDLAAIFDREGLTPVGVLSSHIHIDHSINNIWLRERYGCRVAVPEREAHLTRSPISLRALLPDSSPNEVRDTLSDMLCPADALIPPVDGLFSFCGAEFRVIQTPGHSEGHVVFITPDNVCYAGDTVMGRENNAKLPYMLDAALSIESAQRLRGLNCAAYVVSHQDLCHRIEPLIDHSCDLLRRRAREIAALVTAPMTREELFRAVCQHFSLFSSRPMRVQWMELNFRYLLHYIIDRGYVTIRADHGMLCFCPAEEG